MTAVIVGVDQVEVNNVRDEFGPALAARIGLDHIRARCVHFSGWLSRIEALQPLA